MVVEKRFGVLRLIAIVLKVLAWLALIGIVIMGIVMLSTGGRAGGLEGLQGPAAGMVGGLMMIPIGILYFIMFYAWAEGIIVVLDIEENTRLTNALLQAKPQASAPVAAPVAASAPTPVVEALPEPAVAGPTEERRPAPPPAAPPPMPPG
ncbi:MAG: hypothetical protein ABFE08_10220 [Armatimonadia bacterium]